MAARFGRSIPRVGRVKDQRQLRRIPIVGPLLSPLWFAVIVVVLAGAGVTAYAVAGSSPGPMTTGTPLPQQVNNPPSALTAHPGGAVPGSGAFNAVSCSSPTSCVAVGADATGIAVAATSKNAGSTFTSESLPPGTPSLSSVSCSGPSTCVAVGGHDIIASSDGGASWSAHLLSNTDLTLLGAGCQTSTLCLVGGINAHPTRQSNQAVILVSSDGGSTWAPSSVPSFVAGIAAIACTTATRCIAVGSNVLVSNDAGTTWTPVAVNGGTGQLLSITCPSVSLCVAVGPNPVGTNNPAAPGDAVETTDGGNTFSAVTLPVASAAVFEVSCASATSCVAGGAMGTGAAAPVFLSSTNGGASWVNATAPPKFIGVAGLSCPSGGACIAVGSTRSGTAVTSSTAALSPTGQWSSQATPAVQPSAG